ncbi:hypothetical protein [Plebeiibacterium sediminum]|uniref:Uncharacterized protein n=1 Tax=Plebeiibacterium sediminum TaxID=2992112 RepID=A0AAE3SEX8_9BACT|nr:hypothetical protein [Plebeiobacterium sediminum]MCW3786958.1 hypothetical protein [Plebeiobacterium sediminum]
MKLILPAISLIALIVSCSKENQTELLPQKTTSEFFDHNIKSEPFRLFIIEYLKHVDDSIPFADDFVVTFGEPKWDVGLNSEINGCNSLLVPIVDTRNRSISALYYFKHHNMQLEYCLLLNDKDANHYESTQRLIQYFEKTLNMEESNKDIDISIKRAKSSLKTNAYVFETCYSWTQVTEFGTQELHECSSEFFFSSEGPSGSGSGSVGYSNANVDYSIGNSGSGNGNGGPGNGGEDSDDKPFDLPDIINDLDDYPCASSVLEQFTNFNSTISNILRDVFDFGNDVNITFVVDSTLIGTTTSGVRKPGTLPNFTIGMNPDILNNATNEYIAITFAHEAIHALIDYYKWHNTERAEELFPLFVEDPRRIKSDEQHETMANAYIEAMADVISNINPDYPRDKAILLAWGGLEKTWAFELKKMASLTDAYGNNLWFNKFSRVNTAEKNSTPTAVGTKCN